MMEFVRRKWPEILILAILFPGISWLTYHSWDVRDRLVRQETRMDGVVAALPELRTRVAFESVYSPFRTAVVVSEPYQSQERWFADVHLIDAMRGTVRDVVVNLSDDRDRKMLWALTGIIVTEDNNATNFTEMQRLATEVRYADPLPLHIDRNSSHLIYKEADAVKQAAERLGFSFSAEKPLPKVNTWPSLLKAMQDGDLGPPGTSIHKPKPLQ